MNLEEPHDLQAKLQAAVVPPTKKAMSLPKDLQFYRTLDSQFSEDLDACNSRLLSVINSLLHYADKKGSTGKGKAKVQSLEDVLGSFAPLVVSRLDRMFENTDSCLDEFTGRSKIATAISINEGVSGVSVKASKPAKGNHSSKGHLHPDLYHAATLPKPQLRFSVPIDNRVGIPWQPLLREKTNAMIPLEFSDPNGQNGAGPSHPYRHEITHIPYPPTLFQTAEAIVSKSFEETPFQWIQTAQELDSLMHDLDSITELAIDLEHHDYRTYYGFLCLMQISTRHKDYIIDTLVLRQELQVLNKIFTDPSIIKVLHGAESDVIWLQQNFGLYLVNLFDTYHASKVLGFPKHSLAYLLETYCQFEADKKYQLADWRIRPLPQEMLDYARSDTHFLLFIYDNLRNALVGRANDSDTLVREVLSRSEETALRTYVKENYDAQEGTGRNGWANLLSKWNSGLSDLQNNVFKAVHQWRDSVAREEDESPRYIMPNTLLFQLARQPPADLVALKSSLKSSSAVTKSRSPSLLHVIREAVRHSLSQPTTQSTKLIDASESSAAKHVSAPLHADLWGDKNSFNGIVIPSNLFGNALQSSTENTSVITSSLFGGISAEGIPKQLRPEFQSIVEEIHSAIFSAPRVEIPKPEVATCVAANPSEEDLPGSTVSKQETLNIQYVPPSQRASPLQVEEEAVVVGKTRKRKRKNAAVGAEVAKTTSSDETVVPKKIKTDLVAEAPESLPAFDYDAAPKILDSLPDDASSNLDTRPKRKAKKGPAVEYGDFRAPPKNASEVKSGNITKTFR